MDKVLEKTRELGQALIESEAYQAMKAAESKAMLNHEAAELMGRFVEKRAELQQMMQKDDPDPAVMKALADEMDACQDQLVLIDDIVEMTRARDEFNGLMNQVNQVLQFIVTGRMEDPDSGCTGNCGSCAGCH